MGARAVIRTKPDKIPADTNEQAGEKDRDASFGIVVAVIAATLLWALVIGIYVTLFH